MPKFQKNIIIEDVDCIRRPGVGPIYKGKISSGDLAEGLIDGNLKYAPKYQRGYKQDFDENTLFDITHEELEIDQHRAASMAAKFLLGLDDSKHDSEESREFFNPDIIWNARKNSKQEISYSAPKRTLTVHSTLTIPDSAHRHYLHYLLYQWKNDPSLIPDEVEIAPDGQAVDTIELRNLLAKFDPFDEDNSSMFVTIFNITPAFEGRLFDEYNVEGKKPTAGAAIDMFPDKTASRKFIKTLMKDCPIFARGEIEIRRSTIAKGARALTTLGTLDSATKPFQKELLDIQKDKTKHADLIAFFSHFYTEWASHYKEFQPTASGAARQELREKSFAMSNIMYFPMFRLAFELWQKYTKNGTDWRSAQEWKDALAKLAGNVTVTRDGKTIKVPLMARDHSDGNGNSVMGNPDWYGKILIQQFDQNGNPKGWSLSSTRQTRDAAYHYLVKKAGIIV
jgi:hypothetical protein